MVVGKVMTSVSFAVFHKLQEITVSAGVGIATVAILSSLTFGGITAVKDWQMNIMRSLCQHYPSSKGEENW